VPMLEHSTPSALTAIDNADARPLSFRLIEDFGELEALTPAWDELLASSTSAEAMRSAAWLFTWWRTYGQGSGRSLKVGMFCDQTRLVGIWPLCKRRVWHRPGIPLTRLEFLGADVDEHDGVCSEYLGPIVRAGAEEEVQRAFFDALQRGSFGAWHELVLTAMDGAAALPGHLENVFLKAGHRVELSTTTESPYLRLPETWDAYLKSLDKKRRHNIVRALRDFEAWAGADWKLEQARTQEELVRGQKILWDLHTERWHDGAGLSGAFASPRFAAFHQQLMPQLLEEGKIDLFWLTVRGEPVGVHYQIVANKKVYFYQCGRKLDVPDKIRIGVVMLARAIQRAIARGLREFDFLGGPAFYKMQLTQTTRPIVTLRVARPSILESLKRLADVGIGWARGLRSCLSKRCSIDSSANQA
jgi:CelD/BcsL family acetyltransferase involved in cellulose biosynthesis